jgi:DNA-binding SARP family transcriptional activator
MDWAELVRQRVFNNVCEALHGLAQWSLQAGRAAECLEHSQRLLELDNCRQDAALLSMQALLQLGRPEEAARIFDRTRKTLARELEMEPGLPLLEMNQRALLSLPG